MRERTAAQRFSIGSPLGKSTTSRFTIIAIGSAVYLYLNLFASGGTPFLLSGDQTYFWMGAQRLLNGEMPYRDFLQLATPGTDLIFAALFKVFGTRIWVTNLVVVALGVCFACVCFSLSRKLMKDRAAALATCLFMVLIYGKTLNATHHWFAVLLIAIAVRVCMEHITAKSIALSGALLGLAAFFSQAHGAAALLGFAVFLLCRSSRPGQTRSETIRMLSLLVLAFALVLLALSGYYLVTVGIKKLWYCLVLCVFEYLPRQSRMAIGLSSVPPTSGAALLSALYLAIYILLPVTYGISLWRCWRSRKRESFPWDQVTLLSLVGLFLFLEVEGSVTWLRLFAVSLPGIVLAVWNVGRSQYLRRSVIIALSIVLGGISTYQIVSKHAVSSTHAELPGGRFATTAQSYEELRILATHAHPGEFFLQAGWPGDYIPLQVRNPLHVPTLGRWDGVSDQDIVLSVLELRSKRVPYVLWKHDMDEGCRSIDCNDYLSPFRAYLHSSYAPFETFQDGDVLWQKLDDRAALNCELNTKPSDR